tara:strand:+ start:929 stop:1315 length:387 start_codon:yes stop_codon:yes gene_type:complete
MTVLSNVISNTAFIQSANGKQCFFYTGLVDFNDSETTVVDISNSGERDMDLNVLFSSEDDADDSDMKIYFDDVEVLQAQFKKTTSYYRHGNDGWDIFVPMNTSVKITMKTGSSTQTYTIRGLGIYLVD